VRLVTGSSSATSTPIMAMTTSNSTSVNARRDIRDNFWQVLALVMIVP
jgi:hypothetical protein